MLLNLRNVYKNSTLVNWLNKAKSQAKVSYLLEVLIFLPYLCLKKSYE